MCRTDRVLWLATSGQLRALVSPVCQEIVDGLAASGPASIAELAQHLGRPADALYFHVRRLVAAGLVVELPSRKRGRHVAGIYDVAGRPVRIRPSAFATPLVGRILQAALRLGGRDLKRTLHQGAPPARGPRRRFRAGRMKGWLGPAGLQRANELLDELFELLQAGPAKGRGLQSFTYVWAPVTPKARRPRGGGTSQ